MVSNKIHWATFLNSEDDEKLQSFASFLKETGETEGKSRYATVKYMLMLGYDLIYDERLITMRNILYKKGIIKKKSLYDAFNYALLLTEKMISEANNNDTSDS